MDKILLNRFGTSPRLALNNGEWLEHGMHAKTVKFSIGQGGEPPSVNWEDRSAAIGLIESRPAKSLASLLLWGSNENWNWEEDFNEVVSYLKNEMLKRCDENNRGKPKGSYHTRSELAYLMSRMTLHFELYNLWNLYSLEGQLLFSGIKIPHDSYRQLWKGYQNKMLDDIQELVWQVDEAIRDYRKGLEY